MNGKREPERDAEDGKKRCGNKKDAQSAESKRKECTNTIAAYALSNIG